MQFYIRCVLILLEVCIATSTYACDVCGCSSNNQSLGLLPQFSRHFVGLQYTYASFGSAHPSLFEGKPDEHSAQYYNTLQVWGRYKVGKRIQLFAFLPYNHNVNNDRANTATTAGIGDVSLLATVVLIQDKNPAARTRHMLFAGAGIKLPTGKYTGITDLDRQGLPNLQLGTGSYDFPVNVNYTLRYKQVGFNVDAAYTLTTVTTAGYKYGNRLNSSLLGFYSLDKGDFQLIPQAGIRLEYALHDYDNYAKKWLNEQSGGYNYFLSAGAQTYYKRFGFKLMAHIPVAQHYAGGYVTALPKLETGFFFLF